MGAIQQVLLGYGAVPKTYATRNPSDKGANITLSNGNLTAAGTGTASMVRSTIGKSSGKWYREMKHSEVSSSGWIDGVANSSATLANYNGIDTNGWGIRMYNYGGGTGDKNNNNSFTPFTPTSQILVTDVLGVALDMGAGTLTWYKNNVSQGTLWTGLTGTQYAVTSIFSNLATCTVNFGATTMTYTAPTGFNQGLYN